MMKPLTSTDASNGLHLLKQLQNPLKLFPFFFGTKKTFQLLLYFSQL